jgi:hypothetical protein
VLPTFFILGLIFIPLGIGLYLVSESVNEFTFDYTQCTQAGTALTQPPSSISNIAQWAYDPQTAVCTIRFKLPKTFKAPVFLYYRLTNFYQNHRRYVKSVSASQLRGDALPARQVDSECSPLGTTGDLIYYPCGLIANSMFNDNIGLTNSTADFTLKRLTDAVAFTPYGFTSKGIAWPSDAVKYGATKYDLSKITPPKSWKVYNGQRLNPGVSWQANQASFNPSTDEHFQVWMRTAALPTFRKLYGKNLNADMVEGQYEIAIAYNYDVTSYGGTKSIVISTSSWLGGKNPFLGIAYMIVGGVCILLGIIFLVKQMVSPRKLGDHTYLSWNQGAPSSGER